MLQIDHGSNHGSTEVQDSKKENNYARVSCEDVFNGREGGAMGSIP